MVNRDSVWCLEASFTQKSITEAGDKLHVYKTSIKLDDVLKDKTSDNSALNLSPSQIYTKLPIFNFSNFG